MNVITKTVQLPDGRTISIETGKVAKQADGAAVLRMGNTVLLATVCAAKEAVPGTDFMPLQVDYREQYSAAGRFPGGFTKREGKASDEEILVSRLVDRALRPLFPSDYHCEVYVQVMLLSADGVDQPDALAGFAASAAMACSDIPFDYTISEVRVARINGEYVINPTFQQMADADMDLMVGATKDNIMMVEGEMKEARSASTTMRSTTKTCASRSRTNSISPATRSTIRLCLSRSATTLTTRCSPTSWRSTTQPTLISPRRISRRSTLRLPATMPT